MLVATPTRELRLMSTVWTREQEQELAELFQRYSGDQGEEAGRERGAGGPGARGKKFILNFLLQM